MVWRKMELDDCLLIALLCVNKNAEFRQLRLFLYFLLMSAYE